MVRKYSRLVYFSSIMVGHRCPVYFVNIENEQNHDKLDNNYWVAGRTEEEAFKKAQEKFPNKNSL